MKLHVVIVCASCLTVTTPCQNQLDVAVTSHLRWTSNYSYSFGLNILDCVAGSSRFVPLPFCPANYGGLPPLALDNTGDIWVTERGNSLGPACTATLGTPIIHRVNQAGQVELTINHPYRTDVIATNAQGNLLVAADTFSVVSTYGIAAWLHEYDRSGAVVRAFDVRTVVPAFWGGAQLTMSLLPSRDGYIWLGGLGPSAGFLILLDPAWSPVFVRYSPTVNGGMVPDPVTGGVWAMTEPYPLQLARFDLSGALLGQWELGGSLLPEGAKALADGTLMRANLVPVPYSVPPGTVLPSAWPSNLPASVQGLIDPTPLYFGLDGRERVVLTSYVGAWFRFQSAAPYGMETATVTVSPGQTSWFFRPRDTTLHTYASYTDPEGDLDGDGVPNRAEFLNGTNAFVSDQSAIRTQITLGPPGTSLTIDYFGPTAAGLPYLAVVGLAPASTPIGGGYTLPVDPFGDPMVGYCLLPTQAWLSGNRGFLDLQGQAQLTAPLPGPAFSGLGLVTAMVTQDPTRPTLMKHITAALPFTIP